MKKYKHKYNLINTHDGNISCIEVFQKKSLVKDNELCILIKCELTKIKENITDVFFSTTKVQLNKDQNTITIPLKDQRILMSHILKNIENFKPEKLKDGGIQINITTMNDTSTDGASKDNDTVKTQNTTAIIKVNNKFIQVPPERDSIKKLKTISAQKKILITNNPTNATNLANLSLIQHNEQDKYSINLSISNSEEIEKHNEIITKNTDKIIEIVEEIAKTNKEESKTIKDQKQKIVQQIKNQENKTQQIISKNATDIEKTIQGIDAILKMIEDIQKNPHTESAKAEILNTIKQSLNAEKIKYTTAKQKNITATDEALQRTSNKCEKYHEIIMCVCNIKNMLLKNIFIYKLAMSDKSTEIKTLKHIRRYYCQHIQKDKKQTEYTIKELEVLNAFKIKLALLYEEHKKSVTDTTTASAMSTLIIENTLDQITIDELQNLITNHTKETSTKEEAEINEEHNHENKKSNNSQKKIILKLNEVEDLLKIILSEKEKEYFELIKYQIFYKIKEYFDEIITNHTEEESNNNNFDKLKARKFTLDKIFCTLLCLEIKSPNSRITKITEQLIEQTNNQEELNEIKSFIKWYKYKQKSKNFSSTFSQLLKENDEFITIQELKACMQDFLNKEVNQLDELIKTLLDTSISQKEKDLISKAIESDHKTEQAKQRITVKHSEKKAIKSCMATISTLFERTEKSITKNFEQIERLFKQLENDVQDSKKEKINTLIEQKTEQSKQPTTIKYATGTKLTDIQDIQQEIQIKPSTSMCTTTSTQAIVHNDDISQNKSDNDKKASFLKTIDISDSSKQHKPNTNQSTVNIL